MPDFRNPRFGNECYNQRERFSVRRGLRGPGGSLDEVVLRRSPPSGGSFAAKVVDMVDGCPRGVAVMEDRARLPVARVPILLPFPAQQALPR